MKRTIPTLLIGVLIGATVFGGAAFAASGLLAEPSPHHVTGGRASGPNRGLSD